MNSIINKLLVAPLSWLLAVPIVLLDCILAPDLSELSRPSTALRPCPHPERSGSELDSTTM